MTACILWHRGAYTVTLPLGACCAVQCSHSASGPVWPLTTDLAFTHPSPPRVHAYACHEHGGGCERPCERCVGGPEARAAQMHNIHKRTSDTSRRVTPHALTDKTFNRSKACSRQRTKLGQEHFCFNQRRCGLPGWHVARPRAFRAGPSYDLPHLAVAPLATWGLPARARFRYVG